MGTSTLTEKIARRVGISQPYIFRLFKTKRNLFEATVRRCLIETLEVLERAAAGKDGKEALEAIAAAYAELLHERGRLIGRLQSSGACDDPESREIAREGSANWSPSSSASPACHPIRLPTCSDAPCSPT